MAGGDNPHLNMNKLIAKKVIKVFLVTVPLCMSHDSVRQQPFYQSYNPGNLARWRSLFEQNHPQKDYPKIREEFYQMNDRKTPSNIIFEPDEGISFNEYFSEKELEPDMPYGIQNTRDVASRAANENYQNQENRRTVFKTNFQSLCPSVRRTIYLNMTGLEYRPEQYEEVLCVHGYTNMQEYVPHQNKICGQAGFTCIQLSRTIFLTRKDANSNCWESETRIVPAGCECMWPRHNNGDITTYH